MTEQLTLEGPGITGAKMIEDADRWVRANRDTWAAMMRHAKAEYVDKGRRFSMETLFQFARYSCRVNMTDRQFKVNNNTRSALARRMLIEHPDWRPLVDVRRSKVDWY